MPDPFANFPSTLSAPAGNSFDASAAASDTADLPQFTRAIYVGAGGDIRLQLVNDSAPLTWKAVPQGTILDVRARRIYATGTTATTLIGVY